MPSRTRAGQTRTFGGPSCQGRPWWVVQAAAFLYCFQIHSRTNFSVSVFHARFHVSHFSTSPSDRKASPSSIDTASQRCARFLDNKQVSQAEILENNFGRRRVLVPLDLTERRGCPSLEDFGANRFAHCSTVRSSFCSFFCVRFYVHLSHSLS